MSRGADVRLLPPLVFAVPLVGLWLVHRAVPWQMSWGPLDGARPVVGAVLVLAGLILMAWAAWVMTRSRTTVVPWAQVDALVTRAPFTFSRNPIYLSDALVYVGVTLLLGTWWPLLGLPLAIWVAVRWVIRREEAYLGDRFGAANADYRARVRRFI